MSMGLKWGGRFSARDPIAGVPVGGSIFGTIDEVDPAHAATIGPLALQAFGGAAARASRSLADDAARPELAELLAADLAARGIRCRITVAGVRLDEASAAAVAKARAPTAPPAPALAVGAAVLVAWSDGNRYSGRVLEAGEGRCRVGFPDGQEHWIDVRFLAPG